MSLAGALLCHLPGGGTSLLSTPPPHTKPVHSSDHLVTTPRRWETKTARRGRPPGKGPRPHTRQQPLFSWQMCVELNLAAGTVSTGCEWQKCGCWRRLVTWTGRACQNHHLEEHTPSGRGLALRSQVSTRPGPSGPGAGSQHRAEPWALLMARGCGEDEPFGGKWV